MGDIQEVRRFKPNIRLERLARLEFIQNRNLNEHIYGLHNLGHKSSSKTP